MGEENLAARSLRSVRRAGCLSPGTAASWNAWRIEAMFFSLRCFPRCAARCIPRPAQCRAGIGCRPIAFPRSRWSKTDGSAVRQSASSSGSIRGIDPSCARRTRSSSRSGQSGWEPV